MPWRSRAAFLGDDDFISIRVTSFLFNSLFARHFFDPNLSPCREFSTFSALDIYGILFAQQLERNPNRFLVSMMNDVMRLAKFACKNRLNYFGTVSAPAHANFKFFRFSYRPNPSAIKVACRRGSSEIRNT